MDVPFETVPCSFLKDGKPCFYGRTIQDEVETEDELIAETAVACGGANPAFVKCVRNTYFDKVCAALNAGKRIEGEDFRAGLAVHGTFDNSDSPWNPDVNSISPYFTPCGRLKAAVKGMKAVNVTSGPRVQVRSVVQAVEGSTEGVIVPMSGGASLLLAGVGFLLDVEAEDEGVTLRDVKTGQVKAVGTVTEVRSTTLDVTFDELPEAGQYLLVVASRNGMGMDYGVAEGKRKVTVQAVEGGE